MKAMLCKAYGPPESLVLEELPSPPLSDGAVRIAVHACGVNFPDVLIIEGKYQFKPPFPFAPGGEVAGEVVEVGKGAQGLAVGDRVLGMTGWNGYADEVVLDAAKCLKIPDAMDYVTAAGFSMTYGTSYHALVQRASLKEGETLVVHGASGGVGTAAVDLGKAMGARVIATGGSSEKLARIQAHYGLEHVVDYRSEDVKERLKALSGGQGVDVVYDPVGGDITEASLRAMAWEGRLLIVGFASGKIPEIKGNLVLLKGCQVVGVFWGAFSMRDPQRNVDNFAEMFRWYEAGKLKPLVSATYPLADAAKALKALTDREVVGKAVLTAR